MNRHESTEQESTEHESTAHHRTERRCMMKEMKYIVDTTLRDGEQSPGLAFCVEQKVRIALLLEELGVHQIEAGIPALGVSEKEAIIEIMHTKKHVMVSAWNRLSIEDITQSIECRPDIIHISMPVSYVQIYTKLRKNKKWLLKMAAECVDFARSRGCRVTAGFEDASRADIGFLLTLSEQLVRLGVEYVRYADTVGVLYPSRAQENIRTIISSTGMPVEFHAHNDLGMAAANSVMALRGGAKYVDCTLLGIGERAGNCGLSRFLTAAEGLYDTGVSKKQAIAVEEQLRCVLTGSIY